MDTEKIITTSHANDAVIFIHDLKEELAKLGVKVKEVDCQIGDSISQSIEAKLRSDFIILVLSPEIFGAAYRTELHLVATSGKILPILHEIDMAFLQSKNPLLASLHNVKSSEGVAYIAMLIKKRVMRN